MLLAYYKPTLCEQIVDDENYERNVMIGKQQNGAYHTRVLGEG